MSTAPRIAFIAVAVGGAVGALLRALVIAGLPIEGMLSVAIINILGSAALAAVLVLGERRLHDHAKWQHLWRPALVTGLLGGFTTTSGYAVLTNEAWRSGESASAIAMGVGSVALALLVHALVDVIVRRQVQS